MSTPQNAGLVEEAKLRRVEIEGLVADAHRQLRVAEGDARLPLESRIWHLEEERDMIDHLLSQQAS